MNFPSLRLCAVLLVVGGLSACASGGSKDAIDRSPSPAAERPATRPLQDFSGRDANSLSAAEQARVEMEAALARNIVYFEYDQDTLTSEGASTVRAFADYLLSNPAARVRLEGHADERGTREYNLALAERRSRAVEAALTRAGVTSAQITSLSYGEERPTCAESTESCWSQNRRVEIIRL
ncbi:MAG: peptidoglycan-associated lipoprotein Pal [Polycyclovorans sp.]|jgi:peptidoglycan-associated lipoprotein|nr:peptidoglycan-associated lipoprotein [Polycyclovorans sp.]MBU0789343.1 peptidoglycan-associated lipoprotein Pal [Gammaproteobacteria bacterium]MDP1542099.1 peptidoglycan-associated lipoprotein Pal [Polycyclovorans sp.]MEC8848718.1 peptidoglycan-associated lipoprotein Pal [Pseudomonadota bacterium]|tara:strand:- start:7300 stop:7839 length:540 start_codon:yes stop_codon:yes gene_type:complete